MPTNDPTAHEQAAAAEVAARPLRCGVITVSDTRTRATDESGCLIRELLAEQGHGVAVDAIVRDEPSELRELIVAWLARVDLHAILTTGGTGIGVRDSTPEVIRPLLARELEGFGELFRQISYRRIGAAAMLSRAVAGLCIDDQGGETFLFAMPGSTDAVRTAMVELILPQLPHLVWERRRPHSI